MLAQSTSWKRRMASTTAVGFCAVAAESRYTSGLPWTVCFNTGKSSRSFSTSKPAVTSLGSVLMEFLEQDPLQRIPQTLNFDAVHNVLRESVNQQTARLVGADAARPQVEHHLGIELADGGSVGAANVVGVNLRLRLGVDNGFVGETQVL